MFNPLLKLPLIIIFLIAFVGQAMAFYTFGSHEQFSALQSSEHLHLLDKSRTDANVLGHYSDSVETNSAVDKCCDIECCESECICPLNACASIVYFDNSVFLSEWVILRESMLSLEGKDTNFIATSLYRPPIFIS